MYIIYIYIHPSIVYKDKQKDSTRKWVENIPGYYREDSYEPYGGCFESVRYQFGINKQAPMYVY